MNSLIKLSFFLSISLLISGCINVFKLSNLKPESATYSDSHLKARKLLTEMGKVHGISVWDSIDTYNVTFGEEFYGFLGKQGNPFAEQNMTLSLSYIPKTFNGQLEILSGKDKGDITGIQFGSTYFKNSNAEFVSKKNKDTKFWLPTYQYFIEFPNRIQEATTVEYVGTKLINGVKTEGVIASWGSVEPQKKVDQYVIWMDAITKQIVVIEYTVRDMYRFITGAAYFKNYKNYNGLLLPSEYPVESNLVKDGLLHKMSIIDFKVNTIPKDALLPLKQTELINRK